MDKPRPLDSAAGPDLIPALTQFVEQYRAQGEPPQRLLETALGCFPHASAGDVAVAVRHADKRRALHG